MALRRFRLRWNKLATVLKRQPLVFTVWRKVTGGITLSLPPDPGP